jgi:hypothetical protein
VEAWKNLERFICKKEDKNMVGDMGNIFLINEEELGEDKKFDKKKSEDIEEEQRKEEAMFESMNNNEELTRSDITIVDILYSVGHYGIKKV